VDSLLHDESEGTNVDHAGSGPPLDPSSQQEFAERGRQAAAEGEGPERLEEARGLAAFRVQGQAPVPEGRNGLVRVGVRTDGGLALKPCRSTT
jgi:hypothetical protein